MYKIAWNRFRRTANQPDGQDRPEVPQRTQWVLTMCRKCKHVSWWGQPIPRLVTSKEPVEQLKRVNQGKGSSKRIKITDYLRLVMSKPDKRKWRCPACGASVDKCGVATTSSQVLALTQYAMRHEKAGG